MKKLFRYLLLVGILFFSSDYVFAKNNHKKKTTKKQTTSKKQKPKRVSIATAFAPKADFVIHGIDISKHTDNICWESVKCQNIKFAYLKATEGGDYLDPKYNEFLEGVKKSGVPVSAYHFFRFERPAIEQVENFVKNVKLDELDLIPVLDVENAKYYNLHSTDVEYVVSQMKIFLDEIEKRYGFKMIIYVNEHAYNKYVKNRFDEYPIWICSLKEKPEIDAKWILWQYSHTTKINGAKYMVDMNVFNGCEKEFRKIYNPIKYKTQKKQNNDKYKG